MLSYDEALAVAKTAAFKAEESQGVFERPDMLESEERFYVRKLAGTPPRHGILYTKVLFRLADGNTVTVVPIAR